jgi:hypothetical protein
VRHRLQLQHSTSISAPPLWNLRAKLRGSYGRHAATTCSVAGPIFQRGLIYSIESKLYTINSWRCLCLVEPIKSLRLSRWGQTSTTCVESFIHSSKNPRRTFFHSNYEHGDWRLRGRYILSWQAGSVAVRNSTWSKASAGGMGVSSVSFENRLEVLESIRLLPKHKRVDLPSVL